MANDNIIFLGRLYGEQKQKYLSECKALIFPGKEDFGIVPIEAMASGRPIIAYKAGGALDYVEHYKNGFYFNNQTPESLIDAIKLFETEQANLDVKNIRNSVEKFDKKYFYQKFKNAISQKLY